MVFVPFVKERPDVITGLESLKSEIKIGIFGSYHGTHQTDLLSLQIYLKKNGFLNTLIATDLQETVRRKKGETRSAYNQRLSVELVDICFVHIFVLFHEKDGEHGINYSVLGELCEANGRKKQHILVYYQKNVETYIGSFFDRHITDPLQGHTADSFTDLKKKYTIIQGELLEICNSLASNI